MRALKILRDPEPHPTVCWKKSMHGSIHKRVWEDRLLNGGWLQQWDLGELSFSFQKLSKTFCMVCNLYSVIQKTATVFGNCFPSLRRANTTGFLASCFLLGRESRTRWSGQTPEGPQRQKLQEEQDLAIPGYSYHAPCPPRTNVTGHHTSSAS